MQNGKKPGPKEGMTSMNVPMVITQTPEEFIEVGDSRIRKPDGWPAVMAWPPKKMRDAIKAGQINDENAEKFQAYYDRYALWTVTQSERVGKFIDEKGFDKEDRDHKLIPLLRKKKRLGYDDTRNHDHVAWAMLLDPNGDFRLGFDQAVQSYGRTTMTLLDGGKISATQDGVQVHRASKAAAQLIVEEALARGWSSIDISGTPEFVREVMKNANDRGLAVQGTEKVGPFWLMRRKVSNMESIGIDKTAATELAHLASELSPDKKKEKKPEELAEDSGAQPKMQ